MKSSHANEREDGSRKHEGSTNMNSTEHKVGFYSLGHQRFLKYGLKCMSIRVSLMLCIYNIAYSVGLFEGLGA